MPFRKITLVSDVKNPLEKASLDMGRLEELLHQCRQKTIRSDPGKWEWGGAGNKGEREMSPSFSIP